jgi:hypothetical protein
VGVGVNEQPVPWIDLRLIMLRVEQIERRILEKHPRAAKDGRLWAEIRSLKYDTGLPWPE